MVAMSRPEHGERPCTGRPVGAALATTTSATLLIMVLLVASCGQSTTRAGSLRPTRHRHADLRGGTGTIAFLDSG